MMPAILLLQMMNGFDGKAATLVSTLPASLHDDLAAYATASCLAIQRNPYLKDQGSRWAGAIMQQAHGPVEKWSPVAVAVKSEIGYSGIAQGQGEGPQAAPVPLPVITCGMIAHTPAICHTIAEATKVLAGDYRSRSE